MAKSRFRLLFVPIAAAAIAFAAFKYFEAPVHEQDFADYRMPAGNPPLEPDRPDLIGEPRPE